MNHLIVKPMGGLANRMRALESAYCYAKTYNAKLTILWERSDILNANYTDCFAPIKDAKLVETDYTGRSFSSKLKRKFFDAFTWVKLTAKAQKKVDDTYIDGILTDSVANGKSTRFFDELAGANQSVFLETCYEFYPNTCGFRISVQNYIREKTAASLRSYQSLVGVHIRLSDNPNKHQSPVEKFIDKINDNIQQSPDDCYYLSTDSEEVVKELKNLFKDKIITGVSVRSRASKEGIIAALTDMCCLSQCKLILGSYKSSFSERAALIGNIPLQIVSI